MANNMNVERDLQKHLDDMMQMIDDSLMKTHEEHVKTRVVTQADVENDLIEQFNNGWINVDRLQKLSKLVKDACYELKRQHAFKIEYIAKAEHLKVAVDSIRLHK